MIEQNNPMLNFNTIGQSGIDIFNNDEYSLIKVFFALFGSLPNEKRLNSKYKVEKAANYIINKYGLRSKTGQLRHNIGFKYKNKHINIIGPGKKLNTYWLIIIKEGFLLEIIDYQVTIMTNDKVSQQEIADLIKGLNQFIKDKNKKPKFYMISRQYGDFSLDSFNVQQCNTDINLHYNDDFIHFDKDVKEFLHKKNGHGLVLMHGITGTGKTTYIRHLITEVKSKFVFLPLYMAESLSSPELLPFLAQHKNCILIIEDCEKLILDRESGGVNNDIATLLNISDGLLSDALGIKLICTFNTAFSKIDSALTRKGRMVNRYEFKELAVHKASKLAEKHNLPYKGLAPITIGDLFNIGKDNNTNVGEPKGIGFN